MGCHTTTKETPSSSSLGGRTNQSGAHLQAMDDATLAGTGAVLVFLREAKIRDDTALKTMSDDDILTIP